MEIIMYAVGGLVIALFLRSRRKPASWRAPVPPGPSDRLGFAPRRRSR